MKRICLYALLHCVACSLHSLAVGGTVAVWNDSSAGSVDVSKGGRVLVTGDLSSLAPGDYAILEASSISTLDASRWIVALDGSLKRRLQCSLAVSGGSLVLSVKKYGMTIIAR
jgi:hypothetical protein